MISKRNQIIKGGNAKWKSIQKQSKTYQPKKDVHEYAEILAEKKKLYGEYRQVKKDMQ